MAISSLLGAACGGGSSATPDAGLTCETDSPWSIPPTPWQPAEPYADQPFAQKSSLLVTSELGAARAVALDGDGGVVVGTEGGLVQVSSSGERSVLAGWPQVPIDAVVPAVGGRFAAASGAQLLLGQLAEVPESVTVDGEVTALAIAPGGGFAVVVGGAEVLQFDGTSLTPTASFADLGGLEIIDLCGTDGQFALATTTGLWQLTTAPSTVTELVAGEALPSAALRGVACGDAGTVWLATAAGLARVDGAGTVTSYAGAQGLPVLELRGIGVDDSGALLIRSHSGLVTYDPATESWDYYHSRYWIPDPRVSGAVRGGDGTLYIGTSGGLGIVHARSMTLADKAVVMDDGMYERHNRLGYFSSVGLASPGDLSAPVPNDNDNDGQWTGMYLASQAFRYAVTGDAAAKAHADEAAQALLLLHQVTGIPGLMARTVVGPDPEECPPHGDGEWHWTDDRRWCWKGDTSSDEYVGHIFGLSLYYDLVADSTAKQQVLTALVDFHDALIANGYMLVDVDGEVTTWGHFDPPYISTSGQAGDSGLNSAMVLGGLLATYELSGEQRFLDAYYELALTHRYVDNVADIQEINSRLQINHDSEEMSFLALATLIRYETDPCLMSYWQAGLDQLWQSQRPERNPEFNMLYAWLARSDDGDLQHTISALQRMYLHAVQWPVQNSHRVDFTLDPKPDYQGNAQSLAVFPNDQRQARRWAENPFVLDVDGDGMREDILTSWLLPYWMGRSAGLID